MRSTLAGGLIANLRFNLNRKMSRVRMFEIGRVFRANDAVSDGPLDVAGISQPVMLGAVAFGPAQDEQWDTKARAVDFFDLKGDVEALIGPSTGLRFEAAPHPALHPGRSARIVAANGAIGWIGELHPKWAAKYGLPAAPVLFEVDTAPLLEVALPQFVEPSKFPPVMRDIAIAVGAEVPAADVLATFQEAADKRISSISLFDQYRPARPGGDLAESEKSLAFRVVMQDTQRTLTDAEAESMKQNLVDAAVMKHRARLRA
jgi:phenylalanyl-tRNA synthetase beta chain